MECWSNVKLKKIAPINPAEKKPKLQNEWLLFIIFFLF